MLDLHCCAGFRFQLAQVGLLSSWGARAGGRAGLVAVPPTPGSVAQPQELWFTGMWDSQDQGSNPTLMHCQAEFTTVTSEALILFLNLEHRLPGSPVVKTLSSTVEGRV